MPFTIVAENCTGCTACEKRCPTRALECDSAEAVEELLARDLAPRLIDLLAGLADDVTITRSSVPPEPIEK